MSPQKQTLLRVVSILACIVMYFAGIGLLISISKDVPMAGVTNVSASLLAYAGTSVLCLVAMCVYARCIPVGQGSSEERA